VQGGYIAEVPLPLSLGCAVGVPSEKGKGGLQRGDEEGEEGVLRLMGGGGGGRGSGRGRGR